MQVNTSREVYVYTEIPTRDTVVAGLVRLVLCTRRSLVVVVAASLCELHSSGAACSKYTQACGVQHNNIMHATFLCVTQTHVMRTFARSAHIPKRDTLRDIMQCRVYTRVGEMPGGVAACIYNVHVHGYTLYEVRIRVRDDRSLLV